MSEVMCTIKIKHSSRLSSKTTWFLSQACCCRVPTRYFPQRCSRCNIPPVLWRHWTPPKTRRLMCLCFWWGRLFLGLMGYLGTRSFIQEPCEKSVNLCTDACMCQLSNQACRQQLWLQLGWMARRRQQNCSSGHGSYRIFPQRDRTARSEET